MQGVRMSRRDKIRRFFRGRSVSPSVTSQSSAIISADSSIIHEISKSGGSGLSLARVVTNQPTASLVATVGVEEARSLSESLVPELGKKFLADHWKYARELLDDEEKELLQLSSDGSEEREIVADLQKLVDAKQREVTQKAWKIDFGGRRIALRDIAAKMAAWIKSIQSIGETLVSIDPVHAALPWAAVKLLIQVVTADQTQMGLIMIGLEQVAYIITRCKVYERLYLYNMEPQGISHADVMKELSQLTVRLYAKLLSFLAYYVRLIDKNALVKALHSFLNPSKVSDMLSDISNLEKRVSTAANLCEKNTAQLAIHQNNENFRKAREQLQQLMSQLDSEMVLFWKMLNEDERVKIFQWLSDIPYESDHYTAKSGRVEGTGTWLTQHGTYETWRDAKGSTVLWLNGIPGAGKTKLSSKVVDNLLQVAEEQDAEALGLAYFYCDRNRADHRDPVAILRSLVRQLCAPRDVSCVDACVEIKYMERKRKGFARDRLVSEECHEILLQLVTAYRETYLVLDGLDECDQDTRHVLMNILDNLIAKSGCAVKVYVASRTDQDLRNRYQGGMHLEVTANDNQVDIEKFVTEKMKQSEFCCTKMLLKVREEVLKTFHDKSQGMFQWAVLHIAELLALKRNKDILKYLHQLPRGLEAAYENILQRISNQNSSQRDIAFAAFKIVMVSQRPLSPYELIVAVVQDPGTNFYIDEDVDVEYLLEACHNLLVVTDGSLEKPVDSEYKTVRAGHSELGGYQYRDIDDGDDERAMRPFKLARSGTALIGASSICRFSHLSVQEYLESKHWSTRQAEVFMAGICLRTVSSLRISEKHGDWNMHKEGIDSVDGSNPGDQTILFVGEMERLTKFQVIWKAETDDEEVEASKEKTDTEDNSHRTASRDEGFEAPPFQCFCELVHVHTHNDDKPCASIIFNPYIEEYRNTGVEGWAAYAAQKFASHARSVTSTKEPGSADTLKLLIEFVGTPSQSSNAYRAWTVFNQNNYDATTKWSDTSRDNNNGFYSRALLRPASDPALGCAMLGLGKILEAWLKEGEVSPNLTNNRGDSLLVLAIEGEHYEVCELLLEHGANPNVGGCRQMSPLEVATRKRNEKIVAALLKSGAWPNFRSSSSEDYPLVKAVKLGDVGITRQLLEHGADSSVSLHRVIYDTPLILAITRSHVDLVALLLQYAAKFSSWKYHGIIYVALKNSAQIIHESAAMIARLLMPHATKLKTPSMLHLAVKKGNWDFANALVELGLDVNMPSENFDTPLLSVVREDFREMPRRVKQLIDWGADVNAKDVFGCTALYVCVGHSINNKSESRNEGIIDHSEASPPQSNSLEEVITLLLAYGANPNAVDKKGTPLLVAACLNTSMPLITIKKLMDMGADLNLAAGAEYDFMTPLDAAGIRIAIEAARYEKSGDTAGDGEENEGQDNDGKREVTAMRIIVIDQSEDSGRDHDALTSSNKADVHLELLEMLCRAGAKYHDEIMTTNQRTAWRKEMLIKHNLMI